MVKKRLYEIFMPPNVLKAKTGGGSLGFDVTVLRRAEDAVATLKADHPHWLAEDVETLAAAFEAFRIRPDDKTLSALYGASHDLRGQGVMFDFPLISRVAHLLCELIDKAVEPPRMPFALMALHVEAIRVILRDNVRTATDSMAREMVLELEKKGRLVGEIVQSP